LTSNYVIMNIDRISKVIELLENEDLSETDLNLIQLGRFLNLDLVGYEKLKSSQEDDFMDEIREECIKKLNHQNILPQNDVFYAGSIDFMVCDESNEKKYFLLETNGARIEDFLF